MGFVFMVKQVICFHIIFSSVMQPKQNSTQQNIDLRHLQLGSNKQPQIKEQNFQYFQEYCRLYSTAFSLSSQIKKLFVHREKMIERLVRFEKKTEQFRDDIRGEPAEKKKRTRKPAEQIERNFKCEVQRCQRAYGSEGSLKQHIKLKHPQLYQSKSMEPNRQPNYDSQLSLNK